MYHGPDHDRVVLNAYERHQLELMERVATHGRERRNTSHLRNDR
nr:hypothetical protein [Kibdelosporangium sp. MJ126-NF4]CTQ91207.1 hypothetical protein [Kibdelosporangium sp. MJ126-NF4]